MIVHADELDDKRNDSAVMISNILVIQPVEFHPIHGGASLLILELIILHEVSSNHFFV